MISPLHTVTQPHPPTFCPSYDVINEQPHGNQNLLQTKGMWSEVASVNMIVIIQNPLHDSTLLKKDHERFVYVFYTVIGIQVVLYALCFALTLKEQMETLFEVFFQSLTSSSSHFGQALSVFLLHKIKEPQMPSPPFYPLVIRSILVKRKAVKKMLQKVDKRIF